jgi:hypothetical protein
MDRWLLPRFPFDAERPMADSITVRLQEMMLPLARWDERRNWTILYALPARGSF